MNILFTCAGRRNYLLHYFKEALKNEGKILAADMQITAPALAVADKAILVPDVYSDEYVDVLLELCYQERINALISLNDLELPILASAKNRFEKLGVKLIVSDERVIETCFDKFKTIFFGEQIGIKLPKTFLTLNQAIDAIKNDSLKFPLVVKPRWGSASIGIEYPETLDELKLAYRLSSIKISKSILFEASRLHLNEAVMIQEKIIGTEYGLDILNDLYGRTVQVYVKEKLAMRAGETDKAVLRNIVDLEEIGYRIGNALRHIGNVDCDIFEKNGTYYLLEMNPRFGGGYPFSHISGADYPAAICAWLEGRTFDIQLFTKKYDIPFAKCDTLIEVLI